MTTRLTAILIAGVGAIDWMLAAFNLLIADGDPATRASTSSAVTPSPYFSC